MAKKIRVTVGKPASSPAPSYSLERVIDRRPYITGFCGNGQHEGTKKVSEAGTFLRPCQATFLVQGKTYECLCNCHEVFRQIAEITGIRAADSSNVLIGAFIDAPTVKENAAPVDTRETEEMPAIVIPTQRTSSGVASMPGISSLRPVLPAPRSAFSATASGQRARGQLEAEVAFIMNRWFNGKTDGSIQALTPDLVRVAIKTLPPPSNGAIYSIFKRWSESGYVVLEDKPFRIVKPTESGLRALRRWS